MLKEKLIAIGDFFGVLGDVVTEKKRSLNAWFTGFRFVQFILGIIASIHEFRRSIIDSLKRTAVYRAYDVFYTKWSTLPLFDTFFVTLYHLRVIILFVWLIIIFISCFIAPQFLSKTTIQINAPKGTPSYYANKLLEQQFPIKEYETVDTIVMHSRREDINVTCSYLEEFSKMIHERMEGYPNLLYIEDYFYYNNDSSLYLLAPQFVSADQKTMLMLLHYANNHKTLTEVDNFLEVVMGLIDSYNTRKSEFFIGLTGYDALLMAYKSHALPDFERIEIFAFPISFVILAVTIQNFRVLMLPIITMLSTALLAFSILNYLSAFVQFTSFVPSIILSCAIGLSFDYSLFLLTRFREERLVGNTSQMAMRISLSNAGVTVLASGSTLTLCFICLAFFQVDILISMGVACSIGVICCIVSNITIIPAAILTFPQFFGEFRYFGFHYNGILNWGDSGLCSYAEDDIGPSMPRVIKEIFLPSTRKTREEMQLTDTTLSKKALREHRWLKYVAPYLKTGNLLTPDTQRYEDVRERLLKREQKKRRFTLFYYIGYLFRYKIVCAAILVIILACALPISANTFRMKTTMQMQQIMPRNCPAMDAYNMLERVFSPGRISPFYIIMQTNLSNPEGYPIIDQGVFDAISTLSETLVNETGIFAENIMAINHISGYDISAELARQLVDPAMTDPLPETYKYVYRKLVNPTNKTCLIEIDYPRNPYSTESTNWVHAARHILKTRFNNKIPDAQTEYFLIGSSIQIVDAIDRVYSLFPIIIVCTMVLVVVILALTFGSIIIPIRSLFTISLTLSIIYGLSVLFFQSDTPLQQHWSFLNDVSEIYWIVPVMGFTVLIGLGLDYDIFLVMRVAEYRKMGYSTTDSIHLGVYSAGRTITAAGLIMTFAFGGLMLTSEVILFEFGFILCVAVLVDTFIVRTFIVPSMLSIFGWINWFPFPMPEITKSMHDIAFEMQEYEESDEYDAIINAIREDD